MSNRARFARLHTITISKLAAQLAREDAGRYRTLDEIAEDAFELVRAAQELRDAKADGRPVKAILSKAEAIARLYRARVVVGESPASMAMGLRFTSGRYTSGTDNVFPIS